LTSLDELLSELLNTKKFTERLDKLKSWYKKMSEVFCDYKDETHSLVDKIRQCRDEQVWVSEL